MIRRAFTLLELMTAVVIMGIVAGVIMPAISVALGRNADAVSERTHTERSAYALERLLGIVRELPVNDDGTLAFTSADDSTILMPGGGGFQADAGVLYLRDNTDQPVILLDEIDGFSLGYRGADGLPCDPADAWVIDITITLGDEPLAVTGFIRERVGQTP